MKDLISEKEVNLLQRRLIQWYQKNQRKLPWRQTRDPFYIWISEIMLQQTQVKTVIPYYLKFLDRFPDVASLAEADMQTVLKIWEGLGYYARARNLHRAAKIVLERHGGEVPSSQQGFRKLPGVGPYIASAVLSIAYGLPYAVVDGNVKRVLSRLFLIDLPVNNASSYRTFEEIASGLLHTRQPGIFNQAMMELGAMVCRSSTPSCSTCPLIKNCRAFKKQQVAIYPKRIKTKPVPTHHIAVGVVYKKDRVLITRRKSEGLLGGLWEFPGGKIKKKEDAQETCIREIKEEVNLNIKIDSFITRVRHAYTHFKIVLDVFCCSYLSGRVKLNGPVDYRWIRLGEIDDYPFPKANRRFIPLLEPSTPGLPEP
ncbi:MAG: A/G-specific adenine glycosylase [Desulfobacterales bacterium]|nr:A/G-specific adenine glycosylase [Desulfobacterales bacterium]